MARIERKKTNDSRLNRLDGVRVIYSAKICIARWRCKSILQCFELLWVVSNETIWITDSDSLSILSGFM